MNFLLLVQDDTFSSFHRVAVLDHERFPLEECGQDVNARQEEDLHPTGEQIGSRSNNNNTLRSVLTRSSASPLQIQPAPAPNPISLPLYK